MPIDILPGLLVLHGNRAETLAETVFAWLRRQPLQPLEEEIFLVQSNGVAEWLKMALAADSGVCAAVRAELPARFLWRAYRQVLGRDAVPLQSPLDKLTLTWRLMAVLPEVALRPGFEPLAAFLGVDDDMGRRLQLAERLADLFDQYQVYRGDWLAAWEAGRDVLLRPGDRLAQPLPPDQIWQPALWRELLAPLAERERDATRPKLHGRFIDVLSSGQRPSGPVARRVVLFGMTHLPLQTLEALAALSTRCQVVLAVPNPSRFHWADIIEGRELLRFDRRRHGWRNERDLALVPMEDMHAHAHPLLAAWGRQGRDFVRQLDAFDDAVAAQTRFPALRVDLFDEAPGDTQLAQVQARIRDLVPIGEHDDGPPAQGDRSIVFHIAHSAQREVEIVHDQLLELLAHPPGGTPLNPRDIVVMVPDIAAFAPAIRSVFGQHTRSDARFIPFDIADLNERGNNPLLVGIEWLMRLPQQRCRLSEVRDLLDVPAVAARFGLTPEGLARLAAWMAGAGIRWGLDAQQRNDLGLGAAGEQNTWWFGLRRMLLGYASGAAEEFAGIEPYEEIGGLDAALAGSLADVVDALARWDALARAPATPTAWGERVRALLDEFAAATDDRERLTLAALREALTQWLDACDAAGFDQPLSLAVAREGWLAGVDAPTLNRRFRAGGVTFCTLLPMRAIPFEVVCLLGMNDGDYPRASPRSDFDLMGLAGQRRPGDRSRRDDDRQLMLEAVLSARRVLYVSWTGRSVRDNSEQPASVLVSQLRDYLTSGWGEPALRARTTEHPLQPFSRRYFESAEQHVVGANTLFTHAAEWRTAHAGDAAPPIALPIEPYVPDPASPLEIAALAAFLKNPVKAFFRHRLDVVFADADQIADDDEPFSFDGLETWGLARDVIDAVLSAMPRNASDARLRDLVDAQLTRLQRAGRMPIAAPGRRIANALADELVPMLERWRSEQARLPDRSEKVPLAFEHDGLVLVDWLDGLRSAPDAPAHKVWIDLQPGKLLDGKSKTNPRPRVDKLLFAWVRLLAGSACGVSLRGVIVGRDATATLEAPEATEARRLLGQLMSTWRDGMQAPLPFAPRTAITVLQKGKPEAGRTVFETDQFPGEGDEACLSRMFSDYEALTADGRFARLTDSLFGPLVQWANDNVTVQVHAGAEEEATEGDDA